VLVLGLALAGCVQEDANGHLAPEDVPGEKDPGLHSDMQSNTEVHPDREDSHRLQPSSPDTQSAYPPIRFIYAIHTHVSDDRLPYTQSPAGCKSSDMADCTLDESKAANMLATIQGIQEVLERHGARASWQVTVGPLKGLCAYQSARNEAHIFRCCVRRVTT
jgi:hypothetical protein